MSFANDERTRTSILELNWCRQKGIPKGVDETHLGESQNIIVELISEPPSKLVLNADIFYGIPLIQMLELEEVP